MRTFTLDEANRFVPELAVLIPRLREALHAYRFAREQVDDLERMWSAPGRPSLAHPDNPDREEYARLVAEAATAERETKTILAGLTEQGLEVKDPTLGLVDFPAEREGAIVLLCWKEGEAEIEAWHDVQSGFAGRRPIAEF